MTKILNGIKLAAFSAALFLSFSADLFAQHIELLSKSSANQKGNDDSFEPSISADGRYATFFSDARNLDGGDTQTEYDYDYFVRDRAAGTTTGLFFTKNGAKIPGCSLSADCQIAISGNGRYVAFLSTYPELGMGFSSATAVRYDLTTQDSRLIAMNSDGEPADVEGLSISANGQVIAYESFDNLLVPNDTNNTSDCFVYDATSNTTRRVSVSSTGVEGNDFCFDPQISDDGNVVVFVSGASNLVPNDINGQLDVFVHDLRTSQTAIVSKSFSGTSANGRSRQPAINGDGTIVAFTSEATNLVQNNNQTGLFYTTLANGITKLIPPGSNGLPNDSHGRPNLSFDGKMMVFGGRNPKLPESINGDNEIYLYNNSSGKTYAASVSYNGAPGNGVSWKSQISSDGSYIVFQSGAPNLTQDDVDPAVDIFGVSVSNLLALYQTPPTGDSPTPVPGDNGNSPTPTPAPGDEAFLNSIRNSINLAKNNIATAAKNLPSPPKNPTKTSSAKFKADTKKIKDARTVVLNALSALSQISTQQVGTIQSAFPRFVLATAQAASDAAKQAVAKKTKKSAAKKLWNTVKGFLGSL